MRHRIFVHNGAKAAVTACILALAGCQDPRMQAEFARMEDQLKQADKRLEIATAQVEAANAQVAGLKESLEQSQAETKQVKQDVAAQVAEVEKTAGIKRQRLEQEKTELLATLDGTRRALAAAQSQLDEIARQKAEAEKVASALGVWELIVGKNQLRFSFHDDGVLVVRRLIEKDGEKSSWVDPHFSPFYGELQSEYKFRHLQGNAFEISDVRGGKSSHTGRFLVHTENTASIWFDRDGGSLFKDDFGKPKWLSVKKISDASTPQKDSR